MTPVRMPADRMRVLCANRPRRSHPAPLSPARFRSRDRDDVDTAPGELCRQGRPDVILMDWQLPTVSRLLALARGGLLPADVLSQLRSDHRGCRNQFRAWA